MCRWVAISVGFKGILQLIAVGREKIKRGLNKLMRTDRFFRAEVWWRHTKFPVSDISVALYIKNIFESGKGALVPWTNSDSI